MNDTTPEIAEKMCEMIRMKTPEERAQMGSSMYTMSKELVIRAILEENPGISKNGLKQEFFLRFYGEDFDPQTREKILNHLYRT